MNFKDYILESSKYMYDGEYIAERSFELNGKQYHTKLGAELALKKQGITGSKLKAELAKGKFTDTLAHDSEKEQVSAGMKRGHFGALNIHGHDESKVDAAAKKHGVKVKPSSETHDGKPKMHFTSDSTHKLNDFMKDIGMGDEGKGWKRKSY